MPQRALDQVELIDEEGIAVILIGTDRPAEDDHKIAFAGVDGGEIGDPGIEIGGPVAMSVEASGQGAEVLERQMSYRQRAFQIRTLKLATNLLIPVPSI